MTIEEIVHGESRNIELYTEKELAGIAKRENNRKRTYLIVNRLQGKHVPVEPGKCLEMFDALAGTVAEAYGKGKERLLLVGFAETATAIGARLAAKLDSCYIQTTRENLASVEYLYFTEAHSHATEQRLVKTDLDEIMADTDRVVFVEDEVTTGNTIWNIIGIMQETYGDRTAFAVASLLNGMDAEAERRYTEKGIGLHYLAKTDHSGYPEVAEKVRGDGIYHGYPEKGELPQRTYQATGYLDARRLVKGADYQGACQYLYEQMERWFAFTGKERALVIGTEEFMYPALYAASRMEEAGCRVKCHSTTRSPIMVSTEADYPLHERYELHSVYEDGRRTFLYDLGTYDKVIILTDARGGSQLGIQDLCAGLRGCGNTDISVVRWCE